MSHLDPDAAALIALGEEASAEEAAHLAVCDACAADVAALRRTVAAGRTGDGPEPLLTPPPRVWDAIASELGLADPPAASAPSASTPSDGPAREHEAGRSASASHEETRAAEHRVPRRARNRRRGVVLTLIAAVAVVAVVAGTWVARELTRPQVSVIAAAVLDGFPAHPGAEGEAVLEEADGHTRIVVELDADVAADGFREVWLLASDGSGLVSLGLLDGRTGTFAVPAGVDLDLFSLVDISQEEDDGDPGHSGDSIVRGELQPA